MRAGMEVFSAKGYDAATTREIAATAGANEALISRYFGGKRGLLEAILTHGEELVEEGRLPRFPHGVPFATAVGEFLCQYCNLLREHSPFVRVAFSRILVDGDLANVNREEFRRKYLPQVVAELERLQVEGEIAADADLKALALVIFALEHAFGFLFQIVYELPIEEVDGAIAIVRRMLESTNLKAPGAET